MYHIGMYIFYIFDIHIQMYMHVVEAHILKRVAA